MTELRYGLKLSQRVTIEEHRAVWQIADEAGFDHSWVMDHLATIGSSGPDGNIFEAWALQAAMAVATSRTRVGCMVACNTYRHPGVLAKAAVTVDHLSGGRLEFGIGAGWAENEHTMFDLQFGTAGERFDRLEESCEIIRSLWTQPLTTYDGRHYKITEAVAEPKPVQERIPLWIGGNGRKRTLRIAARFADVWNCSGGSPDEVAELSGVLDAHCADLGRDPAEIRRTVQCRVPSDDDETLRLVEDYAQVGVGDIIFITMPPTAQAQAEQVAALLPRLRSIG